MYSIVRSRYTEQKWVRGNRCEQLLLFESRLAGYTVLGLLITSLDFTFLLLVLGLSGVMRLLSWFYDRFLGIVHAGRLAPALRF